MDNEPSVHLLEFQPRVDAGNLLKGSLGLAFEVFGIIVFAAKLPFELLPCHLLRRAFLADRGGLVRRPGVEICYLPL
jgi:hypothetical protein